MRLAFRILLGLLLLLAFRLIATAAGPAIAVLVCAMVVGAEPFIWQVLSGWKSSVDTPSREPVPSPSEEPKPVLVDTPLSKDDLLDIHAQLIAYQLALRALLKEAPRISEQIEDFAENGIEGGETDREVRTAIIVRKELKELVKRRIY